MFTICTTYIDNGKIDQTIAEIADSEPNFNSDIGVLFRKHYQCQIQPHIIWSITEWISEKHHNDAAQSIMKIRRDDRFASIAFGPSPYLEIFCEGDDAIRAGDFSDEIGFFVIAHGVINSKLREDYLRLRKERVEETKERLQLLRIYHNIYNPDEFVAFLGFNDQKDFEAVRNIGEFYLEEYLFTGLRNPMGMSCIAGYNQFICKPLDI